MPWATPKTDWTDSDAPVPLDMIRIESNIDEIASVPSNSLLLSTNASTLGNNVDVNWTGFASVNDRIQNVPLLMSVRRRLKNTGHNMGDLTFIEATGEIVTNDSLRQTVVYDGFNGSIVRSFTPSTGNGSGYSAITNDGTNVITFSEFTNKIYVLDGSTSSVLQSFTVDSETRGLAFDGSNLISCLFSESTTTINIHQGISSTITKTISFPSRTGFDGNKLRMGFMTYLEGKLYSFFTPECIVVFDLVLEDIEYVISIPTRVARSLSPLQYASNGITKYKNGFIVGMQENVTSKVSCIIALGETNVD
jgi:hypothetical protein